MRLRYEHAKTQFRLAKTLFMGPANSSEAHQLLDEARRTVAGLRDEGRFTWAAPALLCEFDEVKAAN